jgi:hypothetical protein
VAAEILIIILVIIVAAIAFAAFTGALNPLYTTKSVYVAGSAKIDTLPQPGGLKDDVLTYLPEAGDAFYLTGQTNGANGTPVTFNLISPSGQTVVPVGSSISEPMYGKTLYIYPNSSAASTQCDYTISQTQPTGALRPMTIGSWTIQMIDENVHVLANTFSETVKNGVNSLPVAGGFLGGSSSQFYDPNCNPIIQTVNGNITTSSTGPGNMTAAFFNGASSITIKNSTGLAFTGDMSISMWFDPSENDTYSSSGTGWQQLIGKGQTTDAGTTAASENDNYQLFQLGNQLLFEWNAPDGTHYQAITTTPTVMANAWNYVSVTDNNGVLNIYDDGNPLTLNYDTGNVPDPESGQTTPPSGSVSLTNNNAFPVNIGEQNYATDSSDAFYYNGYIGSTALYNIALTPQEIADNYAGDTA